jgi:hypothetical protein
MNKADDVIDKAKASARTGHGAQSAINQIPKDLDEIANKIAKGHAFEKHAKELGISTPEELAKHAKNLIQDSNGFRELERGRRAWWHEKTKTIVVHDPNTIDGGSVFRSRNKDYFNDME